MSLYVIELIRTTADWSNAQTITCKYTPVFVIREVIREHTNKQTKKQTRSHPKRIPPFRFVGGRKTTKLHSYEALTASPIKLFFAVTTEYVGQVDMSGIYNSVSH